MKIAPDAGSLTEIPVGYMREGEKSAISADDQNDQQSKENTSPTLFRSEIDLGARVYPSSCVTRCKSLGQEEAARHPPVGPKIGNFGRRPKRPNDDAGHLSCTDSARNRIGWQTHPVQRHPLVKPGADGGEDVPRGFVQCQTVQAEVAGRVQWRPVARAPHWRTARLQHRNARSPVPARSAGGLERSPGTSRWARLTCTAPPTWLFNWASFVTKVRALVATTAARSTPEDDRLQVERRNERNPRASTPALCRSRSGELQQRRVQRRRRSVPRDGGRRSSRTGRGAPVRHPPPSGALTK